MYQKALQELGVHPNEAIFIDDNISLYNELFAKRKFYEIFTV